MSAKDFPAMRGKQLRRIVARVCAFKREGQGSATIYTAPHGGTVIFHYHDGQDVKPRMVRKVLMTDVGLSEEEALKLAREG